MSQWRGFTEEWAKSKTPANVRSKAVPTKGTGKGEIEAPTPTAGAPAKRSKMGNIPDWRGEIRFDSKLEAKYYDYLRFLEAAGEVLYFLRQVPFHLPARVTYRADFMVFYADGTQEVVDVKGRETAVFIIKRKQVELLYPVKIKIVKKGDFPELTP